MQACSSVPSSTNHITVFCKNSTYSLPIIVFLKNEITQLLAGSGHNAAPCVMSIY
jgi:hypothetical protein